MRDHGAEQWRVRGLGNGALAGGDGKLAVLSSKGELVIATASPEGFDEPVVGRFESSLRGVPLPSGGAVYPLWVLQRGLDWYAAQSEPDRKAGRELLASCGGAELLDLRFPRRLTRVGSRMALE